MPYLKTNAHIAVGNERSEKLAEKLGFVLSGDTETLYFHGKDYLHNIYVLNIKTNDLEKDYEYNKQ